MSEKTGQTPSSLESPFLDGEVVRYEPRAEVNSRIDTLAEVNPFGQFRGPGFGRSSARYDRFAEPDEPWREETETISSAELDSGELDSGEAEFDSQPFISEETGDDWDAFRREAEAAFTAGVEEAPTTGFEVYETDDDLESSDAATYESYGASESFAENENAESEQEYPATAPDEWNDSSGTREDHEANDTEEIHGHGGWETQGEHEENNRDREFEALYDPTGGYSGEPRSELENYEAIDEEGEQPKTSGSADTARDLVTVTVMLDQPGESDDEFRLEKSDGSFKKTLSVRAAKDLVAGEKVLQFEGVKPTGTFKLTQKRSRFADRTILLGMRHQDLTNAGISAPSAKNNYLTLPSQAPAKLPDRYRTDRDVDKDLVEASPVLVDLVVEDPQL